ncbi:hypothetical protein B296_00019679 [Ensete ventricosum]|uniref:Uncharacterized protein n=1 Tax=Ensete ventricosum TaxID=4639 RepID=A0A427A5F8_ENSVE|nr:hypothetical protein B296_00019679 [Ensete ventricosum]
MTKAEKCLELSAPLAHEVLSCTSRQTVVKLTFRCRLANMFDLWRVKGKLKKAAPEEVFERAHCTKGKEAKREAVEPLARPFTVRELCKVNDQARKDKYFIMQISDLLGNEAEGPLRARWSNLIASSRVWIDGLLAARGVAPVPHEATLHSFQRADGPSRQSIV